MPLNRRLFICVVSVSVVGTSAEALRTDVLSRIGRLRDESEAAATAALKQVQGLAQAGAGRVIAGLKGNPKNLIIGPRNPIPVLYITKNDLMMRNPNLLDLLYTADELIYPVLGDGKVVAGVALRKRDSGWSIAEVRDPHFLRQLGNGDFFLEITPIDASFSAFVKDDQFWLTSLSPFPALNPNGRPRRAAEIFETVRNQLR